MSIDLHAHSEVSDGTQSPGDVVRAAASAGLKVVALTDHDSTGGWVEADQAGRDAGVTVIPGMEVSCRWQGISVHLLSYGHDSADSEIMDAVATARRVRVERAQLMTERLAEDYPIDWALVMAQAGPDATIGRPHIADALVAAGVVPTRCEAFESVMSGRQRYYVPLPVMDPLDAIRMIREAGGVSVFAHPAAVARGRTVGQAGLKAIIDAGIDGLEVFHRDNPPAARRELEELAGRGGLIVTGSSDYHGAGKPNLLGENVTSPEMLERIVATMTGTAPLGAPLD